MNQTAVKTANVTRVCILFPSLWAFAVSATERTAARVQSSHPLGCTHTHNTSPATTGLEVVVSRAILLARIFWFGAIEAPQVHTVIKDLMFWAFGYTVVLCLGDVDGQSLKKSILLARIF